MNKTRQMNTVDQKHQVYQRMKNDNYSILVSPLALPENISLMNKLKKLKTLTEIL